MHGQRLHYQYPQTLRTPTRQQIGVQKKMEIFLVNEGSGNWARSLESQSRTSTRLTKSQCPTDWDLSGRGSSVATATVVY